MKTFSTAALIAASSLALTAVSASAQISPNQLSLANYTTLTSGGEIVDFSSVGNTLATTGDGTVQLFTLNSDLSTTARTTVDFSSAFGAIELDSVSSTAIDPAGRGFGVASLISTWNGVLTGKVGFYDTNTGDVLGTLDVGFHPDSVKFSADGSKLYVANEGEFTSGGDSDAAGSISVIDLSAVTGTDLGSATNTGNFGFAGGALASGASIDGLRYNDTTASQKHLHVEPEFMALSGNNVLVTLQENNAVGVFDTTTNQWKDFYDLGTITNTVDASDKDGAIIDDDVKGMPMPDALATFTIDGKNYFATANEGDFRVDDGDRQRVKDFAGVEAGSGLDWDAIKDNDALGRLRISIPDSDPDGDGLLNDIIMPGTRSFSIWDAETGELVSDSGSLESVLLLEDPLLHNINDGDAGEFDKRSDDKGPEPEGLDVIQTDDGRTLLAVGMERQNGLILADISDPTNIQLIGYVNNLDLGLMSPESLKFISAADSPNGQDVLVVGYEGVDGTGNAIGFYTIVPEPAAAALLVPGSLMLLRRH